MNIKFRFRRSTLADELATTVEVTSLDQLRDVINDKGGYMDPISKLDSIGFVPLSLAHKMANIHAPQAGRWETHTVTINGDAIGFSDGVVV